MKKKYKKGDEIVFSLTQRTTQKGVGVNRRIQVKGIIADPYRGPNGVYQVEEGAVVMGEIRVKPQN
jgi:hypothetical protein